LKVIDNFLSKEYFDNLKNVICSYDFPWFFCPGSVYSDSKNLNDFIFTHTFYKNNNILSNHYPILFELLEKLNCKALVRIKANLRPRGETIVQSDVHIDSPNNKTAILYLNTNNGYTEFENGDKVESIENRLLIFNSNLKHKGSNCTNQKRRIVLNINYYEH